MPAAFAGYIRHPMMPFIRCALTCCSAPRQHQSPHAGQRERRGPAEREGALTPRAARRQDAMGDHGDGQEAFGRERVYSRDTGRGNSREGGGRDYMIATMRCGENTAGRAGMGEQPAA